MISTAKFRSSSWLSAGLLIALLFGLMPPVGAAGEGSGFAGGSGTEDDPYLIATAQQLARIGDYLDAHFQLIADIDLNLSPYNLGKGWQPIGSEEEPFTGSLDGNDKTIRGLYINRPEEDNIGLFAVIGKDAILRNLRLEDVQITGKDNVGGLVGWTYLGDVENCHVSGTVAGVHKVGGLAGEATRYIRNCYTHCDVRGSEGVGGIAGVNWGTFIASYAAGTTNGREGVGGLVGHNFRFIYDCYATGPVKGEQKVGGLVGSNAEGYVYTSYASGSVTGDAETGGLVGHQGEIGMVYNSYYDRETTGQADTGKGEPRSTAELQWRANYPKWDFAEKWVIADGAGYPLLRWQEDAPRWGFKVSLPEGSAQPGVEFELELTAARGGDGEPLAASREVTVLAGAGGEVVFQGPVEFVGGEARVPLTFASPGTRHLLISMAGFPYSEPIVVEVINPEYAGGSGTLDDPYLIATARQLDHMRYNLTAAFKLLNDIDLDVPPYNEGAGWQPIGSRDRPFLGFFDGNGRSIRGLYLKREAEDDVGLFGALGDGAAVYNVKLEKVKVTGRTPTGGLAGVNEGGSIDTVEVSGTVAGFSDTGGLVGENHGYIKDCYSHCTVTGRGVDLGGLVGDNYGDVMGSSAAGIVSGVHVVGGLLGYHGGTASECSATAAVKGQDWVGGLVAQIDEGGILSRSHAGGTVAGNLYVGGLVAYNAGDIAESYSTGAVTGEKAVGGFIGYNDGAVRDAYATGAVTGSGDCGGFAGHNKGEIAHSFAAGVVSGSEEGGGFAGGNGGVIADSYYDSQTSGRSPAVNQWGIPKTTAEMKRQATFAGWDFYNIWEIREGLTYPRLQWQDQEWEPVFTDLDEVPWAKLPVEVLARRGILRGGREKEYAPRENMTRGDFLYSLIRALRATADFTGNFADVGEGDYYYWEAGVARALGIAVGTGDNKLEPQAEITRQDMLVLAERGLRLLKKLDTRGTVSELARFVDRDRVADYAAESIAALVRERLLGGREGKIDPLAPVTRAEAALFLFKLYNRY